MNWLQEKYIGLISARLPRFKRKGAAYNFRCPICNDSQKDKTKARGYLFQKSGAYVFHCHNCTATMRFQTFLKNVDPVLCDEYSKEHFIETKGFIQTPKKEPTPIEFVNKPKFYTDSPLSALKRVSQLVPDHPAKMYVMKRKIPSNMHYKLFYAPKFKHWVNTFVPQKFDLEASPDEPRLIIPFLDRTGDLYGFQGRSFKKDGLRYITIMLDDSKPKIFGLDTVDFQKHIYIFEGPIDSMFIPNSLAMAGSDMKQASSKLSLDPSRCTVVMDNEPRNVQIVNRIEKTIEEGYNICLWPSRITEKDVNDMILAGSTSAQVQHIIDQNTYSGLSAMNAFANWKKC